MTTKRICFFGKIKIGLLESKNGFYVSLIKSKSELLVESTPTRRTPSEFKKTPRTFSKRSFRDDIIKYGSTQSDVYGKRQTSNSSWELLEMENVELTTV